MANRYWRVRLKGEPATSEIENVASELGGNVVRVHTEKGETRVFVSAPSAAGPKERSKTKAKAKGRATYGTPAEVSEAEVLRLD
jgi:hypothetical protein